MAIKEKVVGPDIRPSLLLDFANSKSLDPRITFTRSSTATYYDGKTTVKAEENLLAYSQAFNSGWSISNAAVLDNNTTAPDGTTTAAKITETDGGVRLQREPFSPLINYSGDIAYSMYFKEGSGTHYYSWLSLRGESGDVFWAVFNLNSGAVTTSGSSGTASISSAAMTSVGNGWYRCQIVGSYGQNYTNPIIYCGLSNGTAISSGGYYSAGSWTSDGSYIYAWGGQVEKRSSATAYTPTTTQPITNYIPKLMTAPAGVARFDHDPDTKESKGLLIEEERTNMVTYSENFSQWSLDNVTLESSATIAPDGTLSATKIHVTNSGSGDGKLSKGTSVSAGTYTISVWVKSAYGTNVSIGLGSYDSGAGSSGFTSKAVTSEWQRITQTVTCGSGASFYIGGGSTLTGTEAVIVWGYQVEAGSFATSYIPTSGSTVTRNADKPTITGSSFSSWYNDSEGTLYAKATSSVRSGNMGLWSFGSAIASATPERIEVRYSSTDTSQARCEIVSAGSSVLTQTPSVSNADTRAIALAYATNNSAVSANGSTASVDTVVYFKDINTAAIGYTPSYQSPGALNGTISKLAYYPARLTDAQLQALTEE